ncbi:MAG: hypothetical protein H6606_10180 [Flavobacteriales bacterium]|nr:hypothetical protein [Flavobacteriales bacterium]
MFPNAVQADNVTLVQVVSGSTVAPDLGKNHFVIPSNGGSGEIWVHAILRDTTVLSVKREYWAVRVLETGSAGLGWSFDYKLYDGEQQISAAPFAITPNFDSSGYVIAGAWQQATDTGIRHEGIQSPFYLEIDNDGYVIRYSRRVLGNGSTGFVPLSICQGEQEGEALTEKYYITVGVQSADFACISCSEKKGRIARIDGNLDEVAARTLKTTFTINPLSVQLGNQSRFDALCKVKKVPGEEEQYLVSGSITGDIGAHDPSLNLAGEAGISNAYIAKIGGDLTVIWDKAFSYTTDGSYQKPVHSSCVDFVCDLKDGEDFNIHGIINVITDQDSNSADCGFYFKLDQSGFEKAFYNIPTTGRNYYDEQMFLTNIFLDDDSIYLTGFAHLFVVGSIGTNDMYELEPIVIKWDRNLNHGESIVVRDSNQFWGTHRNLADCYLGMYYHYTNSIYQDLVRVHDSSNTTTNYTIRSSRNKSPLIYCPSSWAMTHNHGLICHVPQIANNLCYSGSFTFSASPQFCASLYYNLDLSECYVFEETDHAKLDTFDFLDVDVQQMTETSDDSLLNVLSDHNSAFQSGENFCAEPCIGSYPMPNYKMIDGEGSILSELELLRPDIEPIDSNLIIEVYTTTGALLGDVTSIEYLGGRINQNMHLETGIYFLVFYKDAVVKGVRRVHVD